MALQTQLYSIQALSKELGRDRRTIANALDELTPDEVTAKGKRWRLLRVLRHPPMARLLDLSFPGERLNLDQERARLARAQTEKAEIEVAKLRGSVVDVDSVARLIGKLVIDLRARLLSLPSAGAPLLKRCKTIPQLKEEYERQIHDALRDLSDTNPDSFLAALDLPSNAATAADDGEPVGKRKKDRKPRNKRKSRKVAHR